MSQGEMMCAAERVVVTQPRVGICHMQVCVVPEVTEAEILEVCNRENPAGTEHGWTQVIRDVTDVSGPKPCSLYDDRMHFMVVC